MQNIFGDVVDQLDLGLAVERGSQRNDLLPPRDEDRTGGELGKRFSEVLLDRMARGKYDPIPAERVLVPKPGYTTRPASLLTLADRVVYDALVHSLRPRIETSLLGPELVFWPRGLQVDKQWTQFESTPQTSQGNFVALADVAAYYESIDHELLGEVLIEATGRRELVYAMIEFLGRIMGAKRGLPQGLDASDPLASAFLSPVDRAMVRESFHYVRHGDDIRIVTETYGKARHALFSFEQALRCRGLVPNGEKSVILKKSRYEELNAEGIKVVEDTRKKLISTKVVSLEKDPKKIDNILKETDEEELRWAFFYHENLSFEELIKAIAEHIEPSDVDIAIELIDDAMRHPPHVIGGLSKGAFHYRITTGLLRLAAAKSPQALKHLEELMRRYPDKAEIVSNYLMSVHADHCIDALTTVFKILSLPEFQTEWELSWLLHVVYRYRIQVNGKQLEMLEKLVDDEEAWPSCRVSATRVLATHGKLQHSVIRRMWNVFSKCHHPHLVAAAYYAKDNSEWAEPFLAGVRNEPVYNVILRHLENGHSA